MRCRGCDRCIEVRWRTVEVEAEQYVTMLENLCDKCLFWVDVALNDVPIEGLDASLGEWGDEEISPV